MTNPTLTAAIDALYAAAQGVIAAGGDALLIDLTIRDALKYQSEQSRAREEAEENRR